MTFAAQRGSSSVTYRALFRNRNFRLLWMAFAMSSLGGGSAIYSFLTLIGFEHRAGTEQVSLLAALFLLSQVLTLPLAGLLLDRINPARLLTWSELMRAGLLLLLLVSVRPLALYPLALLFGLMGSFFVIARLPLTSQVVTRPELAAANALTTQALEISLLLAPGLTGFLWTNLDDSRILALLAVPFLFSALSLAQVDAGDRRPRWVGESPPPSPERRQAWALLVGGIRFGFCHPTVRYVIVSLSLTLLVVGSLSVLGVIYVRDVLRAGPQTFGWIASTAGAGTLAGIFVMGKVSRLSRRLTLVGGIFGVGGGLLVITFLTSVAKILVCAFGIGVATAAIIIAAQTLLQEETPPELMGRAAAVSWACLLIAQTVSVMLSGVAARIVGIRGLYQAAGCLLLITAGAGVLPLAAARWTRCRVRPT